MRSIKKLIALLLAIIIVISSLMTVSLASMEDWQQRWNFAISDESVIALTPGGRNDEIGFCWLSGHKGNKFEICTDSAFSIPASVSVKEKRTITGQVRCTVNLSGLTSEDTYYYRYTKNGQWSDIYAFKMNNPDDSLTVLVTSDAQLGRSGDSKNRDVLLHDTAGWDTSLSNAMKNNPDISLILSAGDQAEEGFSERQYRLFLAPDILRSVPIATTIGNHEFYFPYLNLHFNNPNRFANSIAHSFGDEPYYFTKGNALFIVLDSNNLLSWDQEAVLEKAIRANPDTKWRVVMMHHSLYSCEDTSADGPLQRKLMIPLLQKYGIHLVISGHTHRYSHSYPMWDNNVSGEGIVFLESGCTSGCNCKRSPDVLPEYTAFGYPETNPVYSVLRFDDNQIFIESFAVEDGVSASMDSFAVKGYEHSDSDAHMNGFARFVQNALGLITSLFPRLFL